MAFDTGHALVIGVGNYQYHPSPKNLPATIGDAEQIRQVLRSPALCGYPDGQITLLTKEDATRAAVLDRLDRLATVDPDAIVFIYFAGHGGYGQDGNYYLTTHDTRVQEGKIVSGTGVSEKVLMDKLRAIKAKGLVLIFNACHSGELMPEMGTDDTSSYDQSLPDGAAAAILSTGEGRIVITACRPQQKSYIVPTQSSTIFGQALIDGLSGTGMYVVSNAGYISAFGLYEHIYQAVVRVVEPYNVQQEPVLSVLNNVGSFPVALYQGATATSMGSFDTGKSLPPNTAAIPIDPKLSQRLLEKYGPAARVVAASAERAVAIGGDVKEGNIITGDNNVVQQATGSHIAQAAPGGKAEVIDNSSHSVFDQRGQTVTTQYNIAGDYNPASAQDRTAAVAELRKLLEELGRAAQTGVLDEEIATDAEYSVKKAIQQAQKSDADKQTIVDYLNTAKDCITSVGATVAGATGLIAAISQAIQMVQKLF